ncbi:hypothetical protein RDV64_19395 [Acuticoccus sp. MNP-M23]|uniref:hypothetical protein n=1 Tax=Acuticoccus sp. MNP-M23 TaxID=3072793 RepID=UPI0028149984|nr:hypothetical protein [Acuticoccus sp. MNP-M23]WMS42208.1 hypothetical protein RDV64_19395 [Acuticoccus sp. MNP-M23]
MIASGGVLPALAQDAAPSALMDPASAVEAFLTDTALLGAESATVESVTTDGDTIIANGVSMRWHAEFQTPGSDAEADATANLDTVRITGLEQTDDGYRASAIVLPNAEITIIGKDNGEEKFNYSTKLVNYALDDVTWTQFPQISNDPTKPVSRFAPLLDWSVDMSFAQNKVERVDSVVSTDGDTQNSSYGPLTMGQYANGKIADVVYPAFSIDQQTEVPVTVDERTGPAPAPDADATFETKNVNLHAEYGEVTATGIDVRPYIQLLTGNGDLSGPSPMIETFRMDGLSLTFDDDEIGRFSIGPIVGNGFTVDPSTGPLLELIDTLVLSINSGEEMNPMTPLMLAFDIYGALGVGSYTVSDIAVESQDITGGIAEIAVEDLNAEGLGRFAISGGNMTGEGRSGALGTFEVSNIVFPERDDFVAMMVSQMMGMPDIPATLQALPALGGMKVAGLRVELPGGTGEEFNLGQFNLALSSYIEGIPTQIAIALDGLSMPASQIDFMPAQMVLRSIGADPVKADGTVSLQWNEDSQTVSMDDKIAIEGVGRFDAVASVSGIPRAIFENITMAQQAIATAAVGDIRVRYDDEGLVPALVGMFAQMSGASSEDFASGIAAQVEMQAGMMAGEELAASIGSALRAFLANPESLTITADPGAPVPVAQLVGAAMTAPAQIATILKLSITAND